VRIVLPWGLVTAPGRHHERPAHPPTYVMSGGMQRAGREDRHQRQARELIAVTGAQPWRADAETVPQRAPLLAGSRQAPDRTRADRRPSLILRHRLNLNAAISRLPASRVQWSPCAFDSG
jgi:hypothetical protein